MQNNFISQAARDAIPEPMHYAEEAWGPNEEVPSSFFVFLIALELRVECYKSLCALTTSPPPRRARTKPMHYAEEAWGPDDEVRSQASVDEVVSPKSISVQLRQLILHIIDNQGYVDGFVRGLTFANRF